MSEHLPTQAMEFAIQAVNINSGRGVAKLETDELIDTAKKIYNFLLDPPKMGES